MSDSPPSNASMAGVVSWGPGARRPFGVALHLGQVLWGNIGAADRLDFTAIGPAVNLVYSRGYAIRSIAPSSSPAPSPKRRCPLIPLGTHALRGIAARCAVFTVRK
jgi:adenylate cyclase